MSSIYLEDMLPGVKHNGLQTAKAVDFSGAASVALPANTTIAGTTAAGATTITSTSATALTVGRQGATAPVLKIDASAATVATGVSVVGAAAASGVAVQAITSGTNESMTIDAAGTGTVGINTAATNSGLVTLGNTTSVAGALVNGPATVKSADAASFTVGRLGATTPAFQVASNTGTQVTGIKITGGAAAGTVAVAVQGGTNEKLTLDSQGSGAITIGGTSTGSVYLARGARKVLVVNNTLTAAGATQNATATAAQLLGGIVSHSSQTGAGTFTLDTGTNISTAVIGVSVGDSFSCLYANIGNQTVTITGDTGSTVVGTAAVGAGKNALMTFYNTGSNTWNVYCNVSA